MNRKPPLDLQLVTGENFCAAVELHAQSMSFLDAMLKSCEQFGIEVEMVPHLITTKLRKALQAESMIMNLLKRKAGRRLPI